MNIVKDVRVIKATKQNDLSDKLRVAAYCRVSTDSSDQLNSFFAQVKYYTDYINSNANMRLVDIYADEGITGTSIAKREDFKRLIADVKKKKIDRVLVKSVTRFARNALECIETVRLFKSNGVSVLFENDNIDTERMNSEMILYIKSAFAQSEALSASRRVAVASRMKMADGTYNLASAPFGYRLKEKALVIEPKEAEIVKKIYELYLSGMGECLIKRYINKTYEGLSFTTKSIGYILTNERYIGDCLLQKRYSPNSLPLRIVPNRGELPKYYYTGTHEPIIDKDTFDKVQAILKEKCERYKISIGKEIVPNKEFFARKIYCRKCGWTFRATQRNGELFWRCRKQGTTDDMCRTPAQSDIVLRQAFIKMFNTLKQNSKIVIHNTLLQLQSLKIKAGGIHDEIIEIDKQIVFLSEQNKVYSELFAQGILDEVTYYEQTDKLKNQITELRSRRLKIINSDEEESCIDSLRNLERLVSSIGCISEFNKDLYNEIVERIYVEENGELTFNLKCGLELKVNMEDGI